MNSGNQILHYNEEEIPLGEIKDWIEEEQENRKRIDKELLKRITNKQYKVKMKKVIR